jgi:hypothetical protein
MDVNDDAYCLETRAALTFIASKLAPTEDRVLGVTKKATPKVAFFSLSQR